LVIPRASSDFCKNKFVWRVSKWKDYEECAKPWKFYCQHFTRVSYYLRYIRWESDISSSATKKRNRRVNVASISKVTRSCFQLVKTGKEQFQMKVSRASSLPVCLSLYFPSYQSASYRLVSTQNQCLDPANYDLFPDRRSYFYWSLHDLIHDSHRESDRFAPMSKIQGARHYAIDIDFLYQYYVITVYKNNSLNLPF